MGREKKKKKKETNKRKEPKKEKKDINFDIVTQYKNQSKRYEMERKISYNNIKF